MDSYRKKQIRLINKQAEEGNLLYHFDLDKIYSYNPSVEKMRYMMMKYGFVMLVRPSVKFQSYLDKILQECKPEETCLAYSQFHGYIDNRDGNTAFSKC